MQGVRCVGVQCVRVRCGVWGVHLHHPSWADHFKIMQSFDPRNLVYTSLILASKSEFS